MWVRYEYGMGTRTRTRGSTRRGLGPCSARLRSCLREREAAAAALPVRTDGAHSMLNTLQLDNSTLDNSTTRHSTTRMLPSAVRHPLYNLKLKTGETVGMQTRAASSELQGVGHWGWHRHGLSSVPSPESRVPSPESLSRFVLSAPCSSSIGRAARACCGVRELTAFAAGGRRLAAGDWRLTTDDWRGAG